VRAASRISSRRVGVLPLRVVPCPGDFFAFTGSAFTAVAVFFNGSAFTAVAVFFTGFLLVVRFVCCAKSHILRSNSSPASMAFMNISTCSLLT